MMISFDDAPNRHEAMTFEQLVEEAHMALWNEAFSVGSELAFDNYQDPETLGKAIARLAHCWHMAYTEPRTVIGYFLGAPDPRYYDIEVPHGALLDAAIETAQEIFRYGSKDETSSPGIIGFARAYHTGVAHKEKTDG